MADPVVSSKLCVVCVKTFAEVRPGWVRNFSWFHNIADLIKSANEAECPICKIVLNKLSAQDIDSLLLDLDHADQGPLHTVSEHRLKAEVCYHQNHGLAFILRRSKGREFEVIAEFILEVVSGKGKCSRTVEWDTRTAKTVHIKETRLCGVYQHWKRI